MTNEEKQLLIKDLSARLSYGVKVMKQFKTQTRTLASVDVVKFRVYFLENDVNSPFGFDIENPLNLSQQIKPYLRPMSSMTDEEKVVYRQHQILVRRVGLTFEYNIAFTIEWLFEHHFDFLGLIDRGLALPAPDGMYN